MGHPTVECFDHIIHHLRQQRDDLDALIKYLEDLEEYRQKNSGTIINPHRNDLPTFDAGKTIEMNNLACGLTPFLPPLDLLGAGCGRTEKTT